MDPAIVMHGGAINPTGGEYGDGIVTAVVEGFELLEDGNSALDAVEHAVSVAEDNPIFNAGTGSHLNLAGDVEMDASIMDGRDRSAGAVASVSEVRNPIQVARLVMDETDHRFLVGRGADAFAHAMGMEPYDPVTEERVQKWRTEIDALREGEMPGHFEKLHRFLDLDDLDVENVSTTGAVAIDGNGDLAAATSSGGFPLKMPGRVGDSPLIGAGTYADNDGGAMSVTGNGELLMREMVSREGVDLMRRDVSAQGAIESIVRRLNRTVDDYIFCGVGIDADGNVGCSRCMDATPHAYMTTDLEEPEQSFGSVLL
jgi:beta-aspartyl-peptidase (threonine type)